MLDANIVDCVFDPPEATFGSEACSAKKPLSRMLQFIAKQVLSK